MHAAWLFPAAESLARRRLPFATSGGVSKQGRHAPQLLPLPLEGPWRFFAVQSALSSFFRTEHFSSPVSRTTAHSPTPSHMPLTVTAQPGVGRTTHAPPAHRMLLPHSVPSSTCSIESFILNVSQVDPFVLPGSLQ